MTHYHYIAQQDPADDHKHMWECDLPIMECALAQATLAGKIGYTDGILDVAIDFHPEDTT